MLPPSGWWCQTTDDEHLETWKVNNDINFKLHDEHLETWKVNNDINFKLKSCLQPSGVLLTQIFSPPPERQKQTNKNNTNSTIVLALLIQ